MYDFLGNFEYKYVIQGQKADYSSLLYFVDNQGYIRDNNMGFVCDRVKE